MHLTRPEECTLAPPPTVTVTPLYLHLPFHEKVYHRHRHFLQEGSEETESYEENEGLG
jgi:hypothetical protein